MKIHNQGIIAASRNLGMREARGEWIAFLDSDDCWYPRKLETIVAATEFDDAFHVISNDELMVNTKTGAKAVLRYGPYERDFYRVLLVEGNRLSPSATVIRRDFIVRHGLAFDETPDYVTVEDYGLWLDLARTGARFKFLHSVQGEYVVHEGNCSSRFQYHWKNCETLVHHHVFRIQRFDSSPDRLWRFVYPRLRFVQIRQFEKKEGLRMALRLALETMTDSPSATAMYILSKFKRVLRNIKNLL